MVAGTYSGVEDISCVWETNVLWACGYLLAVCRAFLELACSAGRITLRGFGRCMGMKRSSGIERLMDV